jgi:hypothetical protein
MTQTNPSHLRVTWKGTGQQPTQPPNPEFPNGCEVHLAAPDQPTCAASLPYPAPCIGGHLIECSRCGARVAVSAAGRPDDPHTVHIRCRADQPAARRPH